MTPSKSDSEFAPLWYVREGLEGTRRELDQAQAAHIEDKKAANEWRAALGDFKLTTVTRVEFEELNRRFAAYQLEVARALSAQAGAKEGTSAVKSEVRESRDDSKWAIGTAAAVLVAVISIATSYVKTQAPPQVVVVPTVPVVPAPTPKP